MLDVLLEIGAAKLVVSAVLAGLAWAVHRRVRHPAVTHPLWLLVLVALLLPAVVAIPVLPGGTGATAVIGGKEWVARDAITRMDVGAASLPGGGPGMSPGTWMVEHGKAGLAIAWLLVASVILGWSLVRAFRFRRWLERCSQPAPDELLREAAEIGRRLGLARMPQVTTASAHLSPMVCWTGGRVRLVIPSFLLDGLGRQELRAVLAHELAHVQRRDHLVRWIEWLACSAFWWNPVAWWARREVRAAEEAACDALGAAAVQSTPREYARSLLQVLDVMSAVPSPATPTFASGVTSVRSSDALERRLRTLVNGRSSDRAPRWVRAARALAAVCLLPLGIVYCDTADPTATEAVEESPEPLPLAAFELLAVVDLNRTDPRAAELKERSEEDPAYSYWIFNSSNDPMGPLPLADAPAQPAVCELEPKEPGESARDEGVAACTMAMSHHLRRTGLSDGGNVCVAWGSRSDGWRGICDGSWLGERDRVSGNGIGEEPQELVVINIRTTQWHAGSER